MTWLAAGLCQKDTVSLIASHLKPKVISYVINWQIVDAQDKHSVVKFKIARGKSGQVCHVNTFMHHLSS
jgi:hypothetical protein